MRGTTANLSSGAELASNSEKETKEKDSGGGGFVSLIALAVISAIGAFGAVYLFTGSSEPPVIACTEDTSHEPTHAPLASNDYVYVDLQEILVTIGNEPATRYVKIQTSIISDSRNMSAVKKAEPMLADAFVGYLRALTLAEFESADFYPKMREQLAVRSEAVLGADVSHGVLITEFLLR